MSAPGAAARAAAARAGALVEAGMHLAPALDRALRGAELAPRDRGLATELCYGAERWRSLLDLSLEPHLRRPLTELQPRVRAILRQGSYQILRLGVPAYAVVDSGTEAAGLVGAGRARGLVNAVLRRVAEHGEPELPPDDLEALALRYAHPLWLVRRWVERLGRADAEALLRENQEVPALVLRVNRRRSDAPGVLADLAQAGLEAEPAPGLPWAVRLRSGGDVRSLPGFREGRWQVQDLGAQAVGECVALADTFLEVACGRGTKTLQQAERQDGRVVGVDVDAERVAQAKREMLRLGVTAEFVCADARELPDGVRGADEVLLDAPCSTLGVVQRRPDVKWRRGPDDVARSAALQGELLEAALAACRPGGVVTYSVCSQEPEETLGPVLAVLARGGAEEDAAPPPLALRRLQAGFLLPGMFVARLRKRA